MLDLDNPEHIQQLELVVKNYIDDLKKEGFYFPLKCENEQLYIEYLKDLKRRINKTTIKDSRRIRNKYKNLLIIELRKRGSNVRFR